MADGTVPADGVVFEHVFLDTAYRMISREYGKAPAMPSGGPANQVPKEAADGVPRPPAQVHIAGREVPEFREFLPIWSHRWSPLSAAR